jgi:hypothetical protein
MRRRRAIRTLGGLLCGQRPEHCPWDDVIAVANESLTTATLATRLIRQGHDLPEEVAIFLESVVARNDERNRRLKSQLTEAAEALNRAGIRPLLMKGTAILALPQGGDGSRMISDLDIMVPPVDTSRSVDSLIEIGYEIQSRPSDPSIPIVLSRPCDPGPIDLHCRARAQHAHHQFQDLATAATPVSLGAGTALLPSPTLQIMILVLHDQFQDGDYLRGLIDLRHLLDIKLLANSPQTIDWPLLETLFSKRFERHALRTQLLTARNLLGLQVPAKFYGGVVPRLQYERRLVQADWPWLMIPLTLFTILAEARYSRTPKPNTTAVAPAETRNRPPPWRVQRVKRALQRLSRPAALGKA